MFVFYHCIMEDIMAIMDIVKAIGGAIITTMVCMAAIGIIIIDTIVLTPRNMMKYIRRKLNKNQIWRY